jgi:hypothetical protein
MFSVHLKPYALAGKLFEYIFEPAFSKCNSIFYEIDFHRFISTLLFAFFRASNTNTSILLQQFSTFARDGDKSALAAMFPLPGTIDYRSNPLHAIGVFAELHRDQITEEMLGFREPGVPNWILDLTTTSLYHLLVKWGAKFESLEVTCDEAKPLKGDLPLFNAMVGRTEKAKVSFQGREHGILFNLSRPLEFGKSHEIPGLQLADVVAAAAGAVWNASYSAKPNKLLHGWRDLLVGGLADDSIWPDLSVADLSRPEAFANSAVLMELVDRAVAGRDLCEGMFALHRRAMIAHRSFQSLKESIL